MSSINSHFISRKDSFLLTVLLIVVFGFLFILASCGEMQRERVIFKNSFDRDTVPGIVINNKKFEKFNGTGVLGRYDAGGFELQMKDIPKHDMLRISFDLYIHDSWEGNSGSPDGRDIWIMNIDGFSNTYTTFANPLSCPDCKQAYPEQQPSVVNNQIIFVNNPANANAIKTDLPGACELKDSKGGTVMYRIVRVFNHDSSTLKLGCFSQQEHTDPANKYCNESWSIDNLEIKAIEWR